MSNGSPSRTGTGLVRSYGGAMTEAAPVTVVDDLGALITVQPEATVSRVALQAAGTRVVVFAFDTGQELTEHTAAVAVLLQVLSGRLTVTAAERVVDLSPGGLVHLAARLPHAVIAHEPTVLVLTMLQGT
jgi:quercetin dioxygenase-like cupin family protein